MLLDYMENPPHRDHFPLPGFTTPFLSPQEIAAYSNSLWYSPGNDLYVGWIVDYTCARPFNNFSPVTMDTLKDASHVYISSDPDGMRYKGAVMISELWFQLPFTLQVPPRVLHSPYHKECMTDGLYGYIGQGYESFLLREQSGLNSHNVNHRGVVLFNPIKYVKQINHRIYSEHERYTLGGI